MLATFITGCPNPASSGPGGNTKALFLYVVNAGSPGSTGISAYAIGSDGSLKQVAGSPFATGAYPTAVAVTPNGSFLYITDGDVGSGTTVSEYSIASDGALTTIGSAGTGTDPTGVTITPNGSFLYVTNAVGGTVSGYSIASNGTLAELKAQGSPFNAGTAPDLLVATPDSSFLYVTDNTSSSVSEYSIGSNGALTSIGTTSAGIGAGTDPQGIAVTSDGSYLYVANVGTPVGSGTTLSVYSIPSNGVLASAATPTVGNGPTLMSVSGSFLYVSNFRDQTVSEYSIGSAGAIKSLTTPPTLGTGGRPTGIAVTPDGQFAYVADNTNGKILSYSISSGVLTPLGGSPLTTGANPFLEAIASVTY